MYPVTTSKHVTLALKLKQLAIHVDTISNSAAKNALALASLNSS